MSARKKVEQDTRKEVKTRKMTWHVFETDDDGRLRRPKGHRGYYGDEETFNTYGYDTPEEAYVAIEKETKYGGYFVIPKMSIHTEYV